jgi:preprotein translocase SecE subunit
MRFGINKPGQGYWMRAVTASMIGLLTLATAMWIAAEARRFVANLPKSRYSMTLQNVTGAPLPGGTLTLVGEPPRRGPGEPPVLGTAQVASYDPQSRRLVLRALSKASDDVETAQIRTVQDAGGFSAVLADRPHAEAVVEPLIVQGAAASIVIIAGALLAYWLVGVKHQTVDFLIATDMEMRKVNWSTRRDIAASTWVVIGAGVLISVCLFVFDLALKETFQLIGVLVR